MEVSEHLLREVQPREPSEQTKWYWWVGPTLILCPGSMLDYLFLGQESPPAKPPLLSLPFGFSGEQIIWYSNKN